MAPVGEDYPIGTVIGWIAEDDAEYRSLIGAGAPAWTAPDRTALEMFETILRIRLFEERVTFEYGRGDMPGFVHTYIGAEAVATGVCAHLSDDDLIASTHRGHGHSIAKGCSITGMLAEALRPPDGVV